MSAQHLQPLVLEKKLCVNHPDIKIKLTLMSFNHITGVSITIDVIVSKYLRMEHRFFLGLIFLVSFTA